MEVVIHNGVEYQKAAAVAKDFGYTTDYLGQLCRGRKIDARLVGRAWYVNPKSLTSHQKNRYQTDNNESIPIPINKPDSAPKNYLDRVAVPSVLTNKTVRILKHYNEKAQEVAVKYAADDESLIPHIQKERPPTDLHVQLAESKPVVVTEAKKTPTVTIMKPEPVPIVYLQGKLPVNDIAEKATIEVETIDRKEQVFKSMPISSAGRVIRRPTQPTQPTQSTRPAHQVQLEQPAKTTDSKIRIVKKPLKYRHPEVRQDQIQKTTQVRFSPEKQPVVISQSAPVKNTKNTNNKTGILLPVVLVFLAFSVAVIILGVSAQTSVTKDSSTEKIQFELATIKVFLSNFFE